MLFFGVVPKNDPKNANLGTERGRTMLAASVGACGFGRPILLDRAETCIAGNKTLDEARARGVPVDVVPSDGQTLVVVQRTDLDLDEPTGRLLAYYDNRVSEVDLAWSAPQIHADILDGVNVSVAFFPDELPALPQTPETPTDDPDREPTVRQQAHVKRVHPPSTFDDDDGEDAAPVPAVPMHAVDITHASVAARERWRDFLRALARRDPMKAPGDRICHYLRLHEGL